MPRSKFKNRIKRVLYRPVKKNSGQSYLSKKLEEAEKALEHSVGGLFGGQKKRRKRRRF